MKLGVAKGEELKPETEMKEMVNLTAANVFSLYFFLSFHASFPFVNHGRLPHAIGLCMIQ